MIVSRRLYSPPQELEQPPADAAGLDLGQDEEGGQKPGVLAGEGGAEPDDGAVLLGDEGALSVVHEQVPMRGGESIERRVRGRERVPLVELALGGPKDVALGLQVGLGGRAVLHAAELTVSSRRRLVDRPATFTGFWRLQSGAMRRPRSHATRPRMT